MARDIVEKQIGSLRHSSESKGITIRNELPDDMMISVDSELFGQVLHNLLSNSIKFTGKGGSISVAKANHDKLAISIRDTGVGIKNDLLHRLFDGDVQTTTFGTEGEKGTGIGLPYSYDIMRAHGGNLTVEKTDENGSIFPSFAENRRGALTFLNPQDVLKRGVFPLVFRFAW